MKPHGTTPGTWYSSTCVHAGALAAHPDEVEGEDGRRRGLDAARRPAELPDTVGPNPWDVAYARVADQLGIDESGVLFAEPDLEQRFEDQEFSRPGGFRLRVQNRIHVLQPRRMQIRIKPSDLPTFMPGISAMITHNYVRREMQ